jgi:hypothetical protein
VTVPVLYYYSVYMPAPPDDITAKAILNAKGDQLRFWIDGANTTARAEEGYKKNPLVKRGKVSELQKRLADFYGLDLCSASEPETAIQEALLDPIDREIQRKQWAHLQDLGQEWALSVESGKKFELCSHRSGEFPPSLLHV